MSKTKVEESGKLGLTQAISLLVGSILGASIYILLPELVGGLGTAIFLAFIIGAIPALFAAFYYMQLNAVFPQSGGAYYFSKRLISPYAGFLSSTFLCFGVIGGNVMLLYTFVNYLSFYIPDLPFLISAISVMAIFFILNYFGINIANSLQTLMVLWIVLALLAFIVPGIFYHVSGSGMETANPFLPGGAGELLAASITAFMGYTSIVQISSIGGKLKNPKKTAPLAIILSLIVAISLFSLVAFTATLVAPSEMIANSSAALPDIALLYLPESLSVFIGISGIFAIITTLNGSLMTIPNELYRLSKDGHVPSIFGFSHKKYKTPVVSLFTFAIGSILLVLFKVPGSILIHMLIVGILLSVTMSGIAAFRLRKKEPKAYAEASFHLPLWLFYPSTVIGVILGSGYSLFIIYQYPIIGIRVCQ